MGRFAKHTPDIPISLSAGKRWGQNGFPSWRGGGGALPGITTLSGAEGDAERLLLFSDDQRLMPRRLEERPRPREGGEEKERQEEGDFYFLGGGGDL